MPCHLFLTTVDNSVGQDTLGWEFGTFLNVLMVVFLLIMWYSTDNPLACNFSGLKLEPSSYTLGYLLLSFLSVPGPLVWPVLGK